MLQSERRILLHTWLHLCASALAEKASKVGAALGRCYVINYVQGSSVVDTDY